MNSQTKKITMQQDERVRQIKARLARLRAVQFVNQVEQSTRRMNRLLENRTTNKQTVRNSAFIVF